MRSVAGGASSGVFVPLTVTATVPAGFSSADPWSPTLDGILAYAFMRELLGKDFGTNIDVRPVEGLPLAVTRWRDLWWYQSGYPDYVPVTQRTKHFHRRFDVDDADRHMTGKRKVDTSMGAYKNTRKPKLVHVCREVTWKAIGDPAEIERLLQGITSIGSGHTRGYGQVTGWTVREGFDGRIRRSLPAAYAEEQGIRGNRIHHGFRPPSWLPENQMLCIVPDAEPVQAADDSFDFFACCEDLVSGGVS
jgi:CRISPR type IV-associated protein Csf3